MLEQVSSQVYAMRSIAMRNPCSEVVPLVHVALLSALAPAVVVANDPLLSEVKWHHSGDIQVVLAICK